MQQFLGTCDSSRDRIGLQIPPRFARTPPVWDSFAKGGEIVCVQLQPCTDCFAHPSHLQPELDRALVGMTSGRTQEISSESMLAALAETLTLESAARIVGCSAPSISYRAKSEPIVAAAVQAQDHARTELLAESIMKHRGVLSKVATDLNLDSPAAVRYHIVRNPRLKQVFEDSRYRVIDVAEDNVFKAVESGSVKDSWRLLATLGKDRGYTERREVDTQVTHTIDRQSSSELLAVLEQLSQSSPQAVEAQFSEIPIEDRLLLQSALVRLNAVAAESVVVEA